MMNPKEALVAAKTVATSGANMPTQVAEFLAILGDAAFVVKSTGPRVYGDIAGEADREIGGMILKLIEEASPASIEDARVILRALIRVAGRLHEIDVGRFSYLFPFPEIVDWLDQQARSSNLGLASEATYLLEAIAKNLKRLMIETHSRGDEATMQLVALGRLSQEAAQAHIEMMKGPLESNLRRLETDPHAFLSRGVGRALKKISKWAAHLDSSSSSG